MELAWTSIHMVQICGAPLIVIVPMQGLAVNLDTNLEMVHELETVVNNSGAVVQIIQ